MSEEKQYAGFCTSCGWKIESFDSLSECPNCKTKIIPCSYEEQVNISINWYELHIIFCYAERWAIDVVEKSLGIGGRGLIYAIAERIQEQHPKLDKLTIAGEINRLRDEGFDIRTNIPGEEI